MPSPWYRSLPPSGLTCLMVVILWAWKSDTASPLERAWVGMMLVATGFGLWGLARALQTRGWVDDEQARHPRQDYAAALSVAWTHVTTHACTMVTTIALLVFGLAAAFTRPANPGASPTRVQYILTVAMLIVGVAKTYLNIYLVYKRDKLTHLVREIGGD